ncbi:hypothetical protein RB196_35400 [Streptomyces sp. PmtA]|uniref:helix-turn-helix domain-containing protein n=1 Tax=Streptomyces sp. PmtA TaxID=3074275 RepID=UPI0030153C3A
MTTRRDIEAGTPAGDLALFMVGLVRGATVRELAARFGRSSSTWGNYLNGSQLVPKLLLGRLVEAYTAPGSSRNAKALQANELWAAADRERRRAAAGGTLVRQHQRRDDALQQVIKYQALAANAEKHLAELRPMLAYTQSRLENAELQLKMAGERERARIERLLAQARERLGRVKVQQERARSRRVTSEEQQEFWMTEALAAQEEINRMEREAADLIVAQGAVEPVRPREVDDSEFELRLEHITAEGIEDEALLDDRIEPASARPAAGSHDATPVPEELRLPAVPGPVQPVSNHLLDKPSGRTGDRHRAAYVSVAYALHQAGPARLAATVRARVRTGQPARVEAPGRGRADGTVRRWWDLLDYNAPVDAVQGELTRRLLVGTALVGLACVGYLAFQAGAEDTGAAGMWVTLATFIGLPQMYVGLRILRTPRLRAWLLAGALHGAWSALLVLDLLPWNAPPSQFSP